jgi:hypothetical protein
MAVWGFLFLNRPSPAMPRVFFWRMTMWKIVVGFIVFAGLALYLLNRGGDIDMGGEKHGVLSAPWVSMLKS